jgi:hypothetical protein
VLLSPLPAASGSLIERHLDIREAQPWALAATTYETNGPAKLSRSLVGGTASLLSLRQVC